MDLSEFLLARITEDEERARAATEPDEMRPWGDVRLPLISLDQVPNQVRDYLGGTWGEHFARWHMARVLVECEAKRQIVARFRDTSDLELFAAMRLLALPYADHPDYREGWRP